MRTVLELSPRRARLVENASKTRLESTPTLTVTLVNHPAVGTESVGVKVQYPDVQEIEIDILTLTGQPYKRMAFRRGWSRQLDLATQLWERGVYFVRVTVGLESVVKRIVVP